MVRIETEGISAKVKNFKWETKDDSLDAFLKYLTKVFLTITPLSPADGDPDFLLSDFILNHLEGEIIEAEPNVRKGRIY